MSKSWYQSRTIWGAIISVVAIALRNYGIDLDSEDQQQIAQALCDIAAVLGSIVAVHGRVQAKEAIK